MRILGQVALSSVAVLVVVLFVVAFSDYRNQRCQWSSDFGNCEDARGTMKTAIAVLSVAVIGLAMIRKGRA